VHLRYKLGVAVLALAGIFALWLGVLRDSSLFQVRSVTVTGLSGSAAPQVQGALELTAREMTTTDFSSARLRAAVSGYAAIASLSATTEFPHGVRIDVVERRPFARLDVNGTIVAVSANDRALRGMPAPRSLPLIRSSTPPRGDRVTDSLTRLELALLAAAPRPLRREVYTVRQGAEGLTVRLRHGPLIYFGDATLPHAKWDSAAVVLASPSSRGARYIDVELPGRPAADVGDALTSPQSGATSPSASAATLVGALSSSTSG
jgi:cell division protein FtsQ